MGSIIDVSERLRRVYDHLYASKLSWNGCVESRWANGTCSKKVGKKKMLQKAPAGWWRPLAPGDAGALRVPATFPGTAQLDDAVARGAVVAAYCGDACAHPPGPVA